MALVGYNQGVVQAVPVLVNCNAFLFNFIFENQLRPLLPFNSYLVMDNASIHVDAQIQLILAQKSITLIKLPTYSYDLNPIEMVLGLLKLILDTSQVLCSRIFQLLYWIHFKKCLSSQYKEHTKTAGGSTTDCIWTEGG